MSNLHKAAQAALEALAQARKNLADYGQQDNNNWPTFQMVWKAESDLRAALEQPTADDPLPRPSIRDHLGFSTGTYTAGQMLAFRAEGVAQERERCAKVCEGPFGVNSALNDEEAYYGRQMADAIRKGLDKSQEV